MGETATGETATGETDLGETKGEDRILTLPNAVTLARLMCVPVFVWLLFGPADHDGRYAAAWLLAVLGCTDWVDGYLARRLGQVSTVGKILDPATDRIMLGTAIVSLLVDGSVPLWIGLVVAIREVLISAATIALAAAGGRRIDVQWVGKAGTLLLMVAFPLFLVGHSNANWDRAGGFVGWLVVLPGIGLSWYAAATYVPLGLRALREGRAARRTPEGSAA